MISSPEHFLMELRGRVAVITLNRPGAQEPAYIRVVRGTKGHVQTP